MSKHMYIIIWKPGSWAVQLASLQLQYQFKGVCLSWVLGDGNNSSLTIELYFLLSKTRQILGVAFYHDT